MSAEVAQACLQHVRVAASSRSAFPQEFLSAFEVNEVARLRLLPAVVSCLDTRGWHPAPAILQRLIGGGGFGQVGCRLLRSLHKHFARRFCLLSGRLSEVQHTLKAKTTLCKKGSWFRITEGALKISLCATSNHPKRLARTKGHSRLWIAGLSVSFVCIQVLEKGLISNQRTNRRSRDQTFLELFCFQKPTGIQSTASRFVTRLSISSRCLKGLQRLNLHKSYTSSYVWTLREGGGRS